MSKPTRITHRPETDLPRHEQAIPAGAYPNVYAPYVDPVHRIWRWDWPMPKWAGLPQSERKGHRP